MNQPLSPIPYGFDAVDPVDAIHDVPMWRDGGSNEPRFSGELLITLEALTPLIVGNQQDRSNEQRSALAPQMLDDGRVILGGAGLNGMLRSAMASLLQAPMERVQEHHYTYRPNLAGSARFKEIRAAVVLAPVLPSGGLQVALLDSKEVVFLPQEIWRALGQPNASSEVVRNCAGLKFSDSTDQDKKTAFRKKIIVAKQADGSQDRSVKISLSHTVLHYIGGMDGEGLFASASPFNQKVYRHVFYPRDKLEKAIRNPVTISPMVTRHYHKTQAILANDEIGHLSPGYSRAAYIDKFSAQKAIEINTPLRAWQLIYVEYDAASKQITSFGHHYQYRWAYTSSTNHKAGALRTDQVPTKLEICNEDGSPQQLTAARLLFGYALDGEESSLASGNYKRLAGRISFNHAVEVPGDKSDAQRFVNAGQAITLKVLGQPRPSAVEFYLKQNKLPGRLMTYGDLPADPGGDLAGRKHYHHQPDARTKNNPYQAQQAATNGRQEHNDPATERGTVVHYLSQPGSTFKTTLRFDSLRPWELGALMLALQPQLAEKMGLNILHHDSGYAHKLGYGKPLGLGSVRLCVDAARWQQADSWQWQQGQANASVYKTLVQECLVALKNKLRTTWVEDDIKPKIDAWLQPRQWKEKGDAAYPKLKGDSSIFNFHTDLRKRHAAVRRGKSDDFSDLQNLLEKKP